MLLVTCYLVTFHQNMKPAREKVHGRKFALMRNAMAMAFDC
jgi:hypothetical protein